MRRPHRRPVRPPGTAIASGPVDWGCKAAVTRSHGVSWCGRQVSRPGEISGNRQGCRSAKSRGVIMALDNDRARVAHLLRRAGFGPSEQELTECTQLGFDGAVSRLVNYDA